MHPADSDSDSAGARRLAALLDVERAVADASASATATIEQLSTALQRAGDAGLPDASPARTRGAAVLDLLARRRDVMQARRRDAAARNATQRNRAGDDGAAALGVALKIRSDQRRAAGEALALYGISVV